MLKIFCGFHHGGLARSLWYLFGDRLGHDVSFPHYDFTHECAKDGIWNELHPEAIRQIGAWDGPAWQERGHFVTKQEFLDTQWDVVIVSRTESQEVLKSLGHPKPGTKYIGVSGNENLFYEWNWIPNLLSTDASTYRNSPPDLHKIYVSQEIGRQYGMKFVPVNESSLRTVNSFLNHMPAYDLEWNWNKDQWNGLCPHCQGIPGTSAPLNVYNLWKDIKTALPEYNFGCYGHFNTKIGGKCILECDLPPVYSTGALTFHFKTAEGFGHSLLQSIMCGRPVLVQKNFYRYKTAGRYLIPELTCFESDGTVAELVHIIRRVTETVELANAYAQACFNAAQGLFDWELEAMRVKKWMEDLV